MNKKFINLLLASVLTAGSAQVFTSCKDNEADFQAQIQYEYESLEARVTANEQKIGALQTALDNAISTLRGEINAAKTELAGQISDFNRTLTQKIEAQGLRIDQVDQKLINYMTQTDGTLQSLQQQITNNLNKITNLETDLRLLEQKVSNLEAAQNVLSGRVDTLDALAAGLRVDVDALRTDLTDLTNKVNGIDVTVTDQGNRLVIVESTLLDVQNTLTQLSTDFADYVLATDGRLDILETFKNDWSSILPQIQQNAIDALNKANANEASINAINSTIEELKNKDSELGSAIADLDGKYEDLLAKYGAQQLVINEILEKLDGFVTTETFDEAIAELKAKDAELEALAMANYRKSIGYTNLMVEQVLEQMRNNSAELKADIKNLQSQIDGINGTISGINGAIENLDGRVDGIDNLIAQINSAIETLQNNVNGDISGINNDINEIKIFQAGLLTKIEKNAKDIVELNKGLQEVNGKVVKLQEAINAVNSRIDAIDGRITSIVLQGTEDRVFGSLRLPVGIQSNMLISYFGEALEPVSFPLVGEGAGTYNGEISNALTAQEAADLKVTSKTYHGLYMPEAGDGNGSLGYVYATINPSTVNVQDEKFEYNLVNSRGEKIVEPMHFVPSDKELTFGYSRAGNNNNGFYVAEASVKVDEASLNKIRFTFNDNLKTTVKDILKAPRASANKETVAKLANAVYDQVNGFLPAIGVEASWYDDKNGQMKVTSNYGIATAVVNPLSFGFLYGYKPGHHIPHIMPAIDKIKDKYHVAFDEIKNKLTISLYDPNKPFTVGSISLEAPNIQINLDPSTAEPVVIKVPEIWVDIPNEFDTTTGEVIGYDHKKVFDGMEETIDIAGNINDVINNLKASLEQEFGKIDKTFEDANASLSKLTTDIATQVNDLLQSMQTTVDKTIDDLLADINNKVNGALNNATLNRLVNRLDGIIDRLNGVLDNMNYYLQPVLLYNNNGDFGMVSTSKAMPSVMVLEGQGNAIVLKPTTYTYETVVPVFKKYVAVTKVWANGDKDENNLSTKFDEINNGTNQNLGMNQVISGNDRQIILKLQKGYTYEIMYQALDYSGLVSGRKYYICVK